MGQSSWPKPDTDPDLDRVISDIQFEQLSRMYAGNGLYGSPTDPPLVYADGTGRWVKLRPNRMALVEGHPWRIDADGLLLNIGAAVANRVDLVVGRFDRSTWEVTGAVRPGAGGGVAPLPVVDADLTGAGTGIVELPLARVTVPAGATTITPDQVEPVAWYLAPVPLSATSDTMPPARPGLLVNQADTGRLLMVSGSTWHIVAENGPSTKLSIPHTGWDDAKYSVYAQRRNGFVWFQAIAYKASPSADLAANTNVVVAVLPDQYRPLRSFVCGGTADAVPARFFVNSATGVITMTDYSAALKAGKAVTIDPRPWPANNVVGAA